MSVLKTYTELPPLVIPPPSRPKMPEGYGVPKTIKGALSWDWVDERMKNALVYWIGSISPGSHPHLMPNWGAWIDNYVVFNTAPETRKARNFEANPHISIGVQDGQHGVIIEGVVGIINNKAVVDRMDDEYQRKYKMREGVTSAYVLFPHKAIALADFPLTPTRWIFESAATP